MSLFGTLMTKIFGSSVAVAQEATQETLGEVKQVANSPLTTAQTTSILPNPNMAVDVVSVLTALAETNKEKLNWKTSIVDLMKLVGMDSSLANRKELAAELGFTGDTNDSATLNIWLHKEVMKKLSENGGIIPADLLD